MAMSVLRPSEILKYLDVVGKKSQILIYVAWGHSVDWLWANPGVLSTETGCKTRGAFFLIWLFKKVGDSDPV